MMTVIHYFGNEEVAVPFAHGNSNASSLRSRNYVRTCPSVLQAVEEKCKVFTLINTYIDMIAVVPPVTHLPVQQPRNIKQVKNICSLFWENSVCHMMAFLTSMN